MTELHVAAALLGLSALGCGDPPAPGPAEPPPAPSLSAEIEALDAATAGDALARVARRAASEGTPSEQRQAVEALGRVAGELDAPAYRERLRAQAAEALRAGGQEAPPGHVDQTVDHNLALRRREIVDALAVLAPHRAEAVGRLTTLAERRWDADLRIAALEAVQGRVTAGLGDRLLAIGLDRRSPAPVRAEALERFAEVAGPTSVRHLWPIVDDAAAGPARAAAAAAALAGGGREAAEELLRRAPPADLAEGGPLAAPAARARELTD